MFLALGCGNPPPGNRPAPDSAAAAVAAPPVDRVRREVGFRSAEHLADHYRKHGREFEGFDQSQYLEAAQDLRDATAGGNILELAREDGTFSRYDLKSGAFIAFEADGTIRTFFKPNDGEAYFRRQARRRHQ